MNFESFDPPLLQSNYMDYSGISDEDLKTVDMVAEMATNAQPPFPLKLHLMLSKVEKEGLDDVVGWEIHGR